MTQWPTVTWAAIRGDWRMSILPGVWSLFIVGYISMPAPWPFYRIPPGNSGAVLTWCKNSHIIDYIINLCQIVILKTEKSGVFNFVQMCYWWKRKLFWLIICNADLVLCEYGVGFSLGWVPDVGLIQKILRRGRVRKSCQTSRCCWFQKFQNLRFPEIRKAKKTSFEKVGICTWMPNKICLIVTAGRQSFSSSSRDKHTGKGNF